MTVREAIRGAGTFIRDAGAARETPPPVGEIATAEQFEAALSDDEGMRAFERALGFDDE
jgi:hypothetical protein